MRRVDESNERWSTLIALSLIPLSGFAMDIFIPSLPDMSAQLTASPGAIQLTLSIFIISYGISQLVVGGLIDSYGRYVPNLAAILLFSGASFAIAYSTNLHLIYWMRAVQGFTVAVIIVSKRSYFVDTFSGEQLKKYTSLFSVIWAIAPIVAPFLGGFFQIHWGWSSNFIFLGYFGIAFFILEVLVGGESMKHSQKFNCGKIVQSYGSMLRTKNFSAGMMILGLSYAMVLIYGMSSPFLIENKLHYSPAITGYCSLFSGISVFIGASVSRMLIQKDFYKKLLLASGVQLASAIALTILTVFSQNLITLLAYVFVLHSLAGFIFNNLLSYCLMRFPEHAGKASGLVGGGFSVVTSIFSSVLVKMLSINSQLRLGLAYATLAVLVFVLLIKTEWKVATSVAAEQQEAALLEPKAA